MAHGRGAVFGLITQRAMMADNYVRYDEIEDVVTSTDLLALVSARLNEEPLFWKWAVIAAHNALQGAIVCALHDGGIGTGALTQKSAQAVLNWYEQESPKKYPRERLEDFATLLWRFCRKNPAVKEKVTHAQIRDIRSLHRCRNEFQHFTPKGWSIEKAYLSKIIGTAINLIETVMQHETVAYRLTEDQDRRLRGNLRVVRDELCIV